MATYYWGFSNWLFQYGPSVFSDIVTFNNQVNNYGSIYSYEPNGNNLIFDNTNNKWLISCYSNSVYSGSNCLSLKGWRSNAWTNTLFEFTQNGDLIIKSANNSTSTTTGCLQLYGGGSIQQNLYVGGNIYIGNSDSNTDPLYISRINTAGLNITELSVFIGDDGVSSSSLSTFPPATESFPTD